MVARPTADSELERRSEAARKTLRQRNDLPASTSAGDRDEFQRQIEDIVLDLVRTVPDGVADLDSRELLERLVLLRRATLAGREVDALRISMEMDDIIRRIRSRVAHDKLDDAEVALAYVLHALEGTDSKRLAAVLGVTPKTVSNWRKGSDIRGANADRIRLVARCAFELRRTMTSTGLALWFERPAAQLQERSPVQVMDEGLPLAWESLTAFLAGSHG